MLQFSASDRCRPFCRYPTLHAGPRPRTCFWDKLGYFAKSNAFFRNSSSLSGRLLTEVGRQWLGITRPINQKHATILQRLRVNAIY